MNAVSRNVLGVFFALAVIGLIGWYSATSLDHSHEHGRVGVVEVTPVE